MKLLTCTCGVALVKLHNKALGVWDCINCGATYFILVINKGDSNVNLDNLESEEDSNDS